MNYVQYLIEICIVQLYLGDTLRTSFVHGLAMAGSSCLGQNLLNFFVILRLQVFGAPLQLVESSRHPEVVKGGDPRKVDYDFLIKVLASSFGVVYPNDLDEEESSMDGKGGEHPCQGDVSPVGVVGVQSEEVDQVGHDVHTWQAHIEYKEAEKGPHPTGIVQEHPFVVFFKHL